MPDLAAVAPAARARDKGVRRSHRPSDRADNSLVHPTSPRRAATLAGPRARLVRPRGRLDDARRLSRRKPGHAGPGRRVERSHTVAHGRRQYDARAHGPGARLDGWDAAPGSMRLWDPVLQSFI